MNRRTFLRGGSIAALSYLTGSGAAPAVAAIEIDAKMAPSHGVGTHKPYTNIGPLSRERALSLVKVGWYYDWSATPRIYPGLEAVPMVWDEKGVNHAIGGNSRWLLTFNEPDSSDQANMTLRQCAEQYHRLTELNPLSKLVSPAPTADNWGWRDRWLNEYLRLYRRKPRIDAVAAHIYPRTWEYFLEAMNAAWQFAQQFDARIWVTEYAYLPGWPGGMGAAAEMMGKMTQHFLDNPGKFERWAPFILSHTGYEPWAWGSQHNVSLISMDTGRLTAIGSAYVGTQPATDYADPRADIVGGPDGGPDGQVDILDLSFLAANFGMKVK